MDHDASDPGPGPRPDLGPGAEVPGRAHAPGAPKARRDAVTTRRLLVDAARRRFAHDGYQATTVRDVAADAGVNVALINRYFTSKEGLFEACMPRTVQAVEIGEGDAACGVEDVLHELVGRLTRPAAGDESLQLPLMLLLRSSGDERADRIRRATLRALAERLATLAGWREPDPATHHLLVRAEVVLSTLLGVVLLRGSTGLEPLTSASAEDLAGPLVDAVTALLVPGPRPGAASVADRDPEVGGGPRRAG